MLKANLETIKLKLHSQKYASNVTVYEGFGTMLLTLSHQIRSTSVLLCIFFCVVLSVTAAHRPVKWGGCVNYRGD